jgi:predicted DNA-binding protein
MIKEYRLTVKVPHEFEARIKAAAARRHEGNGSALVRVAVEKYLVEIEAAVQEA